MSLYARRALNASTPWPSLHGEPEEAQRNPAPRREVAYVCAEGHAFTRTFFLGAKVPAAWTCRCGAPSRRENAPAGTEGHAELPGYATPGTGNHERRRDAKSPHQHLHERRTAADGAELLAEAMAHARQTGAAR